MHHYHYSLEELENMIPFEREIYILLLLEHIEKQKERAKKKQGF